VSSGAGQMQSASKACADFQRFGFPKQHAIGPQGEGHSAWQTDC